MQLAIMRDLVTQPPLEPARHTGQVVPAVHRPVDAHVLTRPVPGPLPVKRPGRIPPRIQLLQPRRLLGGQRRRGDTPAGQPPPEIEPVPDAAAGMRQGQVTVQRHIRASLLQPFSEQLLTPPLETATVPGPPRHHPRRTPCARHPHRRLRPTRARFGGRAHQGAQPGCDLDGTVHTAHPPPLRRAGRSIHRPAVGTGHGLRPHGQRTCPGSLHLPQPGPPQPPAQLGGDPLTTRPPARRAPTCPRPPPAARCCSRGSASAHATATTSGKTTASRASNRHCAIPHPAGHPSRRPVAATTCSSRRPHTRSRSPNASSSHHPHTTARASANTSTGALPAPLASSPARARHAHRRCARPPRQRPHRALPARARRRHLAATGHDPCTAAATAPGTPTKPPRPRGGPYTAGTRTPPAPTGPLPSATAPSPARPRRSRPASPIRPPTTAAPEPDARPAPGKPANCTCATASRNTSPSGRTPRAWCAGFTHRHHPVRSPACSR